MIKTRRFAAGLLMLSVLWWGHSTAHAQSKKSAIIESMDGVEWGWTPKQVYQHYAKQLREAYQPEMAKAVDAMTEDRLRLQLDRETAKIKDSYVLFDGTPSGYDTGFLRYEYTHNNKESMLLVQTARSDDYFFFIRNKLWKRYRALREKVFGDVKFNAVQKSLEKRFGPGKFHNGVLPGRAEQSRWVEWQSGSTSLRAVDESELYGLYGLIYEDTKTASQISKLRTNKPAPAESRIGIVDQVLDPGGVVPDVNQNVVDQISADSK